MRSEEWGTLAKPLPPVLRWAGSKKGSLKKLTQIIPSKATRYVEVFAGSACLYFHLLPSKALISDNNSELMRFYRILAKSPNEIIELLNKIPREKDTYYAIRSNYFNEKEDCEWAAQFLYLNRNCFNGIYRTNLKGFFNVPFAGSRVAGYPSRENILNISSALSSCELKNDDFEDICINQIKKNDFVYLDPPYYVTTNRVFREYSSKPFSECDFNRLITTLREIDRRGAYFLLSYPNNPIASPLVEEWYHTVIDVRRIISSKVESRGTVSELLIRNYKINI